ncbi:hypothetical protein ES703_123683 [subsurface metagenome]
MSEPKEQRNPSERSEPLSKRNPKYPSEPISKRKPKDGSEPSARSHKYDVTESKIRPLPDLLRYILPRVLPLGRVMDWTTNTINCCPKRR